MAKGISANVYNSLPVEMRSGFYILPQTAEEYNDKATQAAQATGGYNALTGTYNPQPPVAEKYTPPGVVHDPRQTTTTTTPSMSRLTSSSSSGNYPAAPIVSQADLEAQREAAARFDAALQLETQGKSRQSEYDLNQQAQAATMARLPTLFSSFMGSAPAVSRTSGPIAAQEQAARDAAVGRAKDQSGQIARSKLTSLRENLASRGVLGQGDMSGLEVSGTRGIVNSAGNDLGEVIRNQSIADQNQAQHVADLDYQGGITQRGQQLALAPSLLSLFKGGSVY